MHTEDASQNSELNMTMHDAMWRGHGGWEMAMSPALFGLLGWFVDGWLGTTPFVMVIAAIVGFAGSVANQYYRYTDRMAALEAERTSARDATVTSGAKRFAKTEASA